MFYLSDLRSFRICFFLLGLSLPVFVSGQDSDVTPVAKILHGPVGSPAVMVKGRAEDDLYWVAREASDDPRVFAVRSDGSSVIPTFSRFSRWFDQPEEGKLPWQGFRLLYAKQQRWMDMTSDANYLYILDGEAQAEGDAVVYAYGEIDPTASTQAAVIKRMVIDLPGAEQASQGMTLFSDQGELFFLAASRSSGVSLYRMQTQLTEEVNSLSVLEANIELDIPLAAEVSPDSTQLAVMTVGTVVIFNRADTGTHWQHVMNSPFVIEDERLKLARTLVWKSGTELMTVTSEGELLLIRVSR